MQGKAAITASLSHQTDSGNSVLLTPTEAKARGIAWSESPPPAKICEFCGARLEPTGIALFGRIIAWQPESVVTKCNCSKAKQYWKTYEKEQARKMAEKAEQERREQWKSRIRTIFSESGMKKRFQQRTFKNYVCRTEQQQRCFDAAQEYADHFDFYQKQGKGIYFEGTNGTGKTHLAAAIALRLMSRGIPVICRTSEDLLADVKKAYESKDIKEQDVLDTYKNVDLLIIDDLGKEQCTSWSMSVLYNIINARYEDMKPVIVTTNYNADNLARAMTPKGMDNTEIVAIVSRLKETSTVVTMAWEDYRVQKSK